MRPPTDLEIERLAHAYDPAKAHEYYMRVRKLKGRRKGSAPQRSERRNSSRHAGHRARQKHALQANVTNLQKKLNELEKLIQIKEAALKRSAGSNAKKNAQGKAKDKPKTAADKAKAARENEKYRKKHHQELKNKAKQASKSGGGSSSKKKAAGSPKKQSISELKALATKVRGQLAVAKQKLAAL